MSMSACDVAAQYPIDWGDVSFAIVMRRALRQCECHGECGRPTGHLDRAGRCPNRHGEKRRGGKGWQRPTILSLAHLNHEPGCDDPEQLLAMCEGCHLAYDREQHARTRLERRIAEFGLLPLF